MPLNRNGFTFTVNEMINDASIGAGIIGFNDELEGDQVAFALRELNKLSSKYANDKMKMFNRTKILFNPSSQSDEYSIGSGQGYVSDRINLDSVSGDQIVSDRDLVPGEISVSDNVRIYDEYNTYVGEFVVVDTGSNSVRIDNTASDPLDVNIRYIMFSDSADLPDIVCLQPDRIESIRYGQSNNGTQFTISEESATYMDNRNTNLVSTIPSIFAFIKGSIGKLLFDTKAIAGRYQINAYTGIPNMGLGTTIQLPDAIYIDLIQTALMIRLGKYYRRDMSRFEIDLIKLESQIDSMTSEDYRNVPDRVNNSYYSLRADAPRG